jgi:hypothetical protein
MEDIIKDMYRYARDFPVKVIPHITENQEINDIIHNYKRSTKSNGDNGQGDDNKVLSFDKNKEDKKNNLALEQAKPVLEEQDIQVAKKEIQKERTARIIGLISHLVYWNVFGHLNTLPLDNYHKKQLFIAIAQI